MSRQSHRLSHKLEALLGERDDLRVMISLEADRSDADPAKLMAMSRRLALVERAIEAEPEESEQPVRLAHP